MWKVTKHHDYTTPPAYHVPGTTMTVPNLAPSLIELLSASARGEGLPLIGKPMYDENEAAGIARIQAASSTASEAYAVAEDEAVARRMKARSKGNDNGDVKEPAKEPENKPE